MDGGGRSGCRASSVETPRVAAHVALDFPSGQGTAPPITPEGRPRGGGAALSFSPIEQMKTQLRQTSHSNRPVFRVPAGRGTKATCKRSLNSAHGLPHSCTRPLPAAKGGASAGMTELPCTPGSTGTESRTNMNVTTPRSAPICLSPPSCDKCTGPQLTEAPISLCGPSPPPTATMLDWTEGSGTRHTEHM